MCDGMWGDLVPNQKYRKTIKILRLDIGGEGGIRTPDGLAPMPHFECGAFDHSATSPRSWSAVAGAAH